MSKPRLPRLSQTTREAIFSLRRQGLSGRAIARQLDLHPRTAAKYARIADERVEVQTAAESAGVPVDALVALGDWLRQTACAGCKAPILFLTSQPTIRCRACGRIHQTKASQ